jgi:hypothetical protein
LSVNADAHFVVLFALDDFKFFLVCAIADTPVAFVVVIVSHQKHCAIQKIVHHILKLRNLRLRINHEEGNGVVLDDRYMTLARHPGDKALAVDLMILSPFQIVAFYDFSDIGVREVFDFFEEQYVRAILRHEHIIFVQLHLAQVRANIFSKDVLFVLWIAGHGECLALPVEGVGPVVLTIIIRLDREVASGAELFHLVLLDFKHLPIFNIPEQMVMGHVAVVEQCNEEAVVLGEDRVHVWVKEVLVRHRVLVQLQLSIQVNLGF